MEYAVLAGIVVVALAALGTTLNTGFADLFTGLFTKVSETANK
jgi:pilus assembly protein Flp/PilA